MPGQDPEGHGRWLHVTDRTAKAVEGWLSALGEREGFLFCGLLRNYIPTAEFGGEQNLFSGQKRGQYRVVAGFKASRSLGFLNFRQIPAHPVSANGIRGRFLQRHWIFSCLPPPA